MTHHDHSKVEVDELGNITAATDNNGNTLGNGVKATLSQCGAYQRYIDRRNSHPTEDPRASARWANDWPASATTGPFTLSGGSLDKSWVHITDTADAKGVKCDHNGQWESFEVQRIAAAQDEYPPVFDRPTFFLAVTIAALAGLLAGIIAGAWVMG